VTRVFFWAAAASLTYSYFLFPAMVFMRAVLRPRPHQQANITPSVTVVIAARNEVRHIGRKLESLRRQDYPTEQLQIVIVSDGSDDGTSAVVENFGMQNARVLDLPRVGKAEALRAGAAVAIGEIIVFSDANSICASDAISWLVRSFQDPAVGGVAGNQVYLSGGEEDATASGERSYWDLDRALKLAQSRAGNVISATGALYAIRRQLFRPIPPGVTDDMFLSLSVIDAGYRLVFEPAALVYETVAPSRSVEYGRKVRIMTRGLRCVATVPRVLDPRRSGFYAVQLFSHKVLRRLMAVPLLVLGLTSLRLTSRGPVYRLSATIQLAFYLMAVLGLGLSRRRAGRTPFFALPAYFCLVQAASLHATWNLLRGRLYDRWEPARDQALSGAFQPSGERT